MSRLILLLLLSPLAVSAQFVNVVLAAEADGQSAPLNPSVVINPDNPKNIIVGVSPDRAFYSVDGGLVWKEKILKSAFGIYGQPALSADDKGNVFYFHVPGSVGDENWLDRITIQKSTDKGASWGQAVFTGLNAPKDNFRPQPAHHIKNDLLVVTWTQFDQYNSTDTSAHSNILFSRSTSKGDKWSDAVRVNKLSGDCADGDFTAAGATPTISIDGKIFVVWTMGGNIYLDRSYDEGRTWLKNDITIAKQIGGAAFLVPGLTRCNGLPQALIDNSSSPFHGSLYVLWSDQRNGEDDTNIWLTRSSNRGDNWSAPIKVNQDASEKHQFMPWMAVDQTTGILYLVYYDRRNHDDNQTDVYLAWSLDGGNKFSEVKISEAAFTPDGSKSLGEHIGLFAHKGLIVPVWTRIDNGKTKVVATVIHQADLIKK